MTALEPLLTVEQVAEILAVKPSTVRAYCEARKLAHVRIGGRLRFRASEVAEFVERRHVAPRRHKRIDSRPN